MKLSQFCLLFSLSIFSFDSMAKNIVILATGGTISGAGESANKSQYSSSKINIDQIVKSSAGIEKLANISAQQIMQKGSQDINQNDWLVIAKKVNETLAQKEVDAVVITHGTDTMEETAYFLNLTVKSDKPVILVGAMRPATSISADGPLNLYNAVAVAADDNAKNKGVLVVMNEQILAARDVTKTHTTNVMAFAAPNAGAIGNVHYGKVNFYYAPLRLHTKDSEFDVAKIKKLPQVDIVYAYAGFDPKQIDDLVAANTKAIILAGVGDGNINQETVKALAKAVKKGILVVRSSHLLSGNVAPNVEINDDQFGFLTADNLTPQKARILVMLSLDSVGNSKNIKGLFSSY